MDKKGDVPRVKNNRERDGKANKKERKYLDEKQAKMTREE